MHLHISWIFACPAVFNNSCLIVGHGARPDLEGSLRNCTPRGKKMIYSLAIVGLFHIVVLVWYDLYLEDEYLRNYSLDATQKELVRCLITKNASPRFLFRLKMFSKESWNINKRIRKCLFIYFASVIQYWAVVIVYFCFFN